MNDETLDEATLSMLAEVVSETWDALPMKCRLATSKDEIARVAMLIALAGNLDPNEIKHSILSEIHRSQGPQGSDYF